MSEDLRIEWRKALWTLVVAAILSIGGTIATNWITTATLKERIKTVETEQKALRDKVDLLQIQIQKMVPREKLDDCLNNMDSKLDDFHSQSETHFRDLNQNILEIYKLLK